MRLNLLLKSKRAQLALLEDPGSPETAHAEVPAEDIAGL